jgi:hypothetical protein
MYACKILYSKCRITPKVLNALCQIGTQTLAIAFQVLVYEGCFAMIKDVVDRDRKARLWLESCYRILEWR